MNLSTSLCPEIPAEHFCLHNSARILGYHWGNVQNFDTLAVRDAVRIVGFTRASGLPFEPAGKWIALMAYIPEFAGEMWFHMDETTVAYMLECEARRRALAAPV